MPNETPRYAFAAERLSSTSGCTSRGAELKALHVGPSFINVHPAGDPHCWTDVKGQKTLG